MNGLFSALTKAAKSLVMTTPKSFAEGAWRFFALSAVTGITVSGILLWRYPLIVNKIALGGTVKEQRIEDIFRRKPQVKEEAMELVGQFIARFHPDQFAIVNWTTQTGIDEVWANESTKGWPTATQGIMSRNMMEAVGHMIFDQCWSGELPYGAMHHHSHHNDFSPQSWLVCGMSDSYDLWGYLIIHWDHQGPPEEALQQLERLSRHLERLLFD